MSETTLPPPLAADMPVREGVVDVSGAQLAYRLSGRPSGLPLLVFENGWGSSWHCWAWVERLLAPQTQLLFYDRAGIGGSRKTAPQLAEDISLQLLALLDALEQRQPVLLVGHSYGGLMGVLHAAQQPQRLRALLQLDPTPEADDPWVDQQLSWTRQIARFARLCARLGIPDPIFCPAARKLPQPEARLVVQRAFNSVSSLSAGMDEFQLLPAIRAAIARGTAAVPRLTISANAVTEVKGFTRLLISPDKARQMVERMHALHRAPLQGPQARWQTTPHAHGAMIFTPDGATDVARQIMEYAKSLSVGGTQA